MKNLLFKLPVVLLFISFSSISCSNQSASYDPELFKVKLSFPFNTPKVKQGDPLEEFQHKIEELIKLRKKGMKADMTELTYHYIQPQYLLNHGRVDPDIKYDGYWLKFDDNYKFKYGIYDRMIGEGIFHFDPSTELLLMIDDDRNVEPKMWYIKSNSEFINMLGRPLILIEDHSHNEFIMTSGWANDAYLEQAGTILGKAQNGMQIKMILLESQPSK